MLVPANTPLYGTVRIEGQRMAVSVNSIESGGNILPVELAAYDMDGQAGLFVPNTAERTAMKEAAANIGGSFGTSISFARSASQQLVMDATRGVLSGGSQYLATKMREVKYKPQNKMFHFCKTFCSKITLVNTIQNVI